MRLKDAVIATLLLSWVLVLAPATGLAQPAGKEEELRTRVHELEKRIALLEQAVKQLQAKDSPKTDRENKLVGSWSVADEDLKKADFHGLKLKGDGSCELAKPGGIHILNAKHKIIGKEINFEWIDSGVVQRYYYRVVAVSETEMVLERSELGGASTKIRYAREK